MHRKGAQGGRLVSRGTSRSRSLPSLTFHSDAYSSWASVVVALMWKADFDDARVCHEVSEAWRRVHEERNGGGAWGGQAQCSRCAKRHPRASPSPTSLPPTRPPSPRLRKENNNKGGWLSIEGRSAHHTISSVSNRSTTRDDEKKGGSKTTSGSQHSSSHHHHHHTRQTRITLWQALRVRRVSSSTALLLSVVVGFLPCALWHPFSCAHDPSLN